MIRQNAATIALLSKAWPTAQKHYDAGSCVFTVKYPEEKVRRSRDSVIVYSGHFEDYSYGDEHPFDPKRTSTAVRLIKNQGYLSEPWMRIEEPRMIEAKRLGRSSAPAFVEALKEANSGEMKEHFVK